MNNIQGKVVVITGASSGIGEITAKTLAKLGANVVLGARRLDRLENLVAAIEAEGGKAIAVKMDVTQREDVEHLIKSAVEHFGRVDVLINNAGVMLLSTMDKLRVDEWDKMIDINVKGVLYGIAAVLPVMKAQKSGQIINVSSVAGIKVFSGLGTVYSATKFAVKAISEGLRQEVGSEIRTTTIMPGAVATELPAAAPIKTHLRQWASFMRRMKSVPMRWHVRLCMRWNSLPMWTSTKSLSARHVRISNFI